MALSDRPHDGVGTDGSFLVGTGSGSLRPRLSDKELRDSTPEPGTQYQGVSLTVSNDVRKIIEAAA